MVLFRLIEVIHKKVDSLEFPSADKLRDYAKNKSGKPERLKLFEIEESKSKVTEFTSYADIVKYLSSQVVDDPTPPAPEEKPKKSRKKLLENKLQQQVQEAKQLEEQKSEDTESDKGVNFWDRFK